MTDRLSKGDRVIVVNANESTHNRTGVIAIDDGSSLPYFVEFDDPAQRPASEWYREMDLAPATYRPIAPGEHVPEGADVFIPAGLVSRHGETTGKPGPVKTFSAIDDDGDLPIREDGAVGRMLWFLATDCYINPSTRAAADDEGEKGMAEEVATATGQPIRVLRRHVITLDQPVSPDDLARAARALEPGMRVSVHTYAERMEVVGTDPEDDRG